ncbi:MAG: histidine--tRNA ligase [Clostridia bacterium]
MMFIIPKGTKDVLPQEVYKWHYVEGIAREVARVFGLKEIRTPTFEHTELFLRGVGDTTDIVNKEMYTFLDKGDRSITLKPEGTAGVARSFVENGLYSLPLPMKAFYITPVFRYERPQSGRLREHHQFGVEVFGSSAPEMDVEVISVAKSLFDRLGLTNLSLNINSIGCPRCRADYNKALKEYFNKHIENMCPTCRDRLDKNPLRILDCKEEKCVEINKQAPKCIDFLCDDCLAHQKGLEDGLSALGIKYVINPYIVRGLDYYTRTVFEFISTDIGAQGTVCGGGRYDNLVEEVGGKSCPSVGFGLGLERLILTLESLNKMPEPDDALDIFIGYIGDSAKIMAMKLVQSLRQKGISADTDFMQRSVKAQMKYASKLPSKFTAILGETEILNGSAIIKNMQTGEGEDIAFDNFSEYIRKN